MHVRDPGIPDSSLPDGHPVSVIDLKEVPVSGLEITAALVAAIAGGTGGFMIVRRLGRD